MKRIIFSLFVMMAAITVSAQKYYGRVSDPDGYTNIRRGPSTSSSIVRRYYSGDYLYYTPQTSGWSKVYSGAKSNTFMGYMHTSRIVKVNPNGGNSSSTVNYRSGYIVDPTDDYVNIRRGPGTSYAIARQMSVGTPIYYTKYNSKWYKVYNKKKAFLGYVYYDRIY